MATHADKALKLLLRDKRRFVSVYTPVKTLPSIDFSTGMQAKSHKITFTEGATLTKTEIHSFLKEQVVTGANETYLIIEKAPAPIDLATKIVLFGLAYNVKKVFDSFYSKWHLLILERATGSEIISAEVKDLYASDRTKAYLDWLVNEVKLEFGGVIPGDLVLWPIAGLDLAASLKFIYPAGVVTSTSGDIDFQEVGRRAGYSGTGLVDGVAPKRAISYAQTNYAEVIPLIEQFNTFMGRL